MESLLLSITGTEDTPDIKYNPEAAEFVISGRSLPEDVSTFYKPVFEWLEEVSEGSFSTMVFKFKLEYFNTASSKIILDILMKLEEIISQNKGDIKVEWHYAEADEDMLEAGEEYKELIEVPFALIQL